MGFRAFFYIVLSIMGGLLLLTPFPGTPSGPSAANPEAIDIDIDDDEREGDDDDKEVELAQKEVPAAVFGSIKRPAEQEPVGALERFKRKRAVQQQ